MTPVQFNRYLNYESLTQAIQAYTEDFPHLFRLHSIGKSYAGRDIWLVTATRCDTGPAEEKPAFWVDGNIHAIELAGSSAALYLMHTLALGYGTDEAITRCMDTRAFYICPRVNPDGAEWALERPPKIVRSSVRPYPYDEDPCEGLKDEDMDGDGRILTMRIQDPNGPWKISPDEPRLMVRREPAESGGRYYRLMPEGRLLGADTLKLKPAAVKESLDLNRNFPAQWQPEAKQKGAGPYPASEPEVRAVVDFIVRHPNICGGVAFHTYSGVLLRPFSHQADEELPAEDLWNFKTIGEKGREMTGYPAVSAFHDFRYHPKEIITGTLDDWLYEEQGLFAWTVELWSPQRQAGIGDYKFIDWYRNHPFEDDLKMLRWSDKILEGRGYVDWYPFHHPQLGDVELGGWDVLFSLWNPPPARLEKELAPFPAWLVWHNLLSPRLELHSLKVSPQGADVHLIRIDVQNTGWLPSHVTRQALAKGRVRGLVGEIALPPGSTLLAGAMRQEGGQLAGRANQPCSLVGWGGRIADATDDRQCFEWLVRAAPGTVIGLTVRHERAGTVRAEAVIPG